METVKLKETISKLEFLKTKARSSAEASNIETKIKILQNKLIQRYDN
jgi:hypothetical protein